VRVLAVLVSSQTSICWRTCPSPPPVQVAKVEDYGLLVELAGSSVRALVPALHMAEAGGARNKARFKVRSALRLSPWWRRCCRLQCCRWLAGWGHSCCSCCSWCNSLQRSTAQGQRWHPPHVPNLSHTHTTPHSLPQFFSSTLAPRLQVGQAVEGRVLEVNAGDKRITLTLKKSLCTSKLTLLVALEQAARGGRCCCGLLLWRAGSWRVLLLCAQCLCVFGEGGGGGACLVSGCAACWRCLLAPPLPRPIQCSPAVWQGGNAAPDPTGPRATCCRRLTAALPRPRCRPEGARLGDGRAGVRRVCVLLRRPPRPAARLAAGPPGGAGAECRLRGGPPLGCACVRGGVRGGGNAPAAEHPHPLALCNLHLPWCTTWRTSPRVSGRVPAACSARMWAWGRGVLTGRAWVMTASPQTRAPR
jgi:hypothetical protein